MPEAYATVPDTLKSLPNWVTWKKENKDGKPTKLPYQLSGYLASSTDKATWTGFNEVKHVKQSSTGGIGFVFDGSGIVGIDFDHCLKNGVIDPRFSHIVEQLSTYTEISPSGTGLHLFIRCKEKPYDKGRKKGDIEIYSAERYFTITGSKWNNSPDEIREYPVQLIRELCDPLLNGNKQLADKKPAPVSSPLTMSDNDVLSKATQAHNGPKFNALYHGSTAGYPSESEADMALSMMLVFYTQDVNQIARLMRSSGLYREKWNENPGYLPRTIEAAIAKTTAHYDPNFKSPQREYKPTYQPAEPEHERETITDEQIQAYRDEHIRSFSELPDLPEGFFKDYMNFGIRMSYAYPAFHFGNALALISLVAGRKVSMKSTGATIFPNVFVCCVGPTSTSGKSTACDLMFDQFFGLIRKEQALEELTKKMSPAGLLERLSAIPTRLWYYDECSEFFSDIANRWAESLESIMCSVYDGRAVSYGLAKGKGKTDEYRAKDVFLTCVWNTTDSEMERRAQWSHVTNGFLPRFMWFWCHAKNTPRANREITKEDLAARDALYKQIQRLRTVLDDPKLTHMMESRIVFKPHTNIEKWKLDDDLKHLDKDQEMHRIATARLMPQSYKIAVLFSLMDADILPVIEKTATYPLVLKIPDKYADLAIDICEHYLRPRLEYLMDLSKNNDTKNLQIQVIRCLKNHNGIAKKSLVQNETHINKRNFDETILSLEDAEAIEVFSGTSTGGRKGHILKLLKTI